MPHKIHLTILYTPAALLTLRRVGNCGRFFSAQRPTKERNLRQNIDGRIDVQA
eukprot:SAG31_NODE_3179_length_4583_cov_1.884478_1_plen_53_part_00